MSQLRVYIQRPNLTYSQTAELLQGKCKRRLVLYPVASELVNPYRS